MSSFQNIDLGCRFPELAAITGYKRGCRCHACREAKRLSDRKYMPTRRDNECATGCMSSAAIDRWAAVAWRQMTSREQQAVREVLL